MKAPKILPWIAHKNDIPDHAALNLWRLAAEEAEEMSGCCDSSDYFRLAVNRFIELADEEGVRCAKLQRLAHPPIISSMNWMMREQNRFWQANRLTTQKACRFWLPNLKPFFWPGTGLLKRPHIAGYFQGESNG